MCKISTHAYKVKLFVREAKMLDGGRLETYSAQFVNVLLILDC